MPVRELISAGAITDRIKWMSQAISQDYTGKPFVIVPVLKGSFIFASDLIRSIKHDNAFVDFIGVSSCGGSSSSGSMILTHDLTTSIDGKHVLLVEDVVDSGLTVQFLEKTLSGRNPASLSICTLLHKSIRTRVPVKITYTGFSIDDKFVVGYGMDYQNKYRNLPYIGEICA